MADDLDPPLMAEVVAIGERMHRRLLVDLYRAIRADEAVPDEAMGGRFVYAEVAAETVDAEVRRAADDAVTWAVADRLLELRPTLRWFAPETDADRAYAARYGVRDWSHSTHKRRVDGFAVRAVGEVWLSAALDAAQARRIAAHEVRHLDQHPSTCTYLAESEAREYELRAERSLNGRVTA